MNKAIYHPDFKLGILGGGQLGRMFIQNAINYNVGVHILDPSENAPCKDIATSFTRGDFNDYETVLEFGRDKDVLTIEIEHVNADALFELEKAGVKVFPQPAVLKMIQDKGLQKQFYKDHDIPTAPFTLVEDKADLRKKIKEFPAVQKLRKGGYDGRGVQVLGSDRDLDKAFDAPSVLEQHVDFEKEIAVIVSRDEAGEVTSYEPAELVFNPEANLVEYLFSPADISPDVEKKAVEAAEKVARASGIVGLLAVELFLTKSGEVLVNESAPRTHNSGHHTIEANRTSQFDRHLRSVTGLPAGDTSRIKGVFSAMVNLLGEEGHTGEMYVEGLDEVLALKGVYVHLYGKKITKPFRKMGHVTVVGEDPEKVREYVDFVKRTLVIKTRE